MSRSTQQPQVVAYDMAMEGDFRRAYELAQLTPAHQQCKLIHWLLEARQFFESLPNPEQIPFAFQSLLSSNNSYPEDTLGQNAILAHDANQSDLSLHYFSQIWKLSQSPDPEERALGLYNLGVCQRLRGRDQEAGSYFMEALQAYPSKGLYWGAAAGVLHTYPLTVASGNWELTITSLIWATTLAHQAIILDNQNAQWYLIKAKALLQLMAHCDDKDLLSTVLKILQKAQSVCREDQENLLDNIRHWIQNCEKMLHHLTR